MTKPTAFVQSHITRLFPPEKREEVTKLLCEDCILALGPSDKASQAFLERVQCAVLKCSKGNMENLFDAVTLAQTDWRDLLVLAGFAERSDAHRNWKG